MDGFPHRSYEERHQHSHHHHPYPPSFPRQDQEGQPYEGERLYPPVPSVYEGAPPLHGPYAHTSSGPYGSAYDSFTPSPAPYPHSSSGPYGNACDSGPYGTYNASDPYYSHDPFKSAGDFIASEVPQKAQLPQGQIVRIFCKKSQGFNLAVERDTVVMKPADTEDEAQQWIKDVSYGLRVKDNYGHPAFSLINKKNAEDPQAFQRKGAAGPSHRLPP
ncbi:hypothetical protein KP509_04G108600 [Ceratopteris richardii]|uniref:Uncharacterized protein n=1 Tax=Ceratopteris richardii TaxID=49495 RepID=A0A8T2V033_CERRI|nr:hypothetical protein KP509_04G108600 [Ceratopteris richardii]